MQRTLGRGIRTDLGGLNYRELNLTDRVPFCQFPAPLVNRLENLKTMQFVEYWPDSCLNPRMKGLLALALLSSPAMASDPVHFTSGTAQVALVELYTSEGCSSCPPADHWLGALKDDAGLWKEFVPVEFHVNYWDSLGWKDRLSNPSFTAREYSYAATWGSPNVYTPCFVRNGAEWKPSWGGASGSKGGPAGQLEVTVGADGACLATYATGAVSGSSGYTLHVALLGGGISSRPNAGENEGETLKHDFVVLGLAETALLPRGSELGAQVALPLPSVSDSKRRAVAAWVTREGNQAPVQATGGWLP
jgi:hypothetical protein